MDARIRVSTVFENQLPSIVAWVGAWTLHLRLDPRSLRVDIVLTGFCLPAVSYTMPAIRYSTRTGWSADIVYTSTSQSVARE